MGDIRKYFRESKVFRWTQEELGWVMYGQGWFQLKLRRSTWHFKVDFRSILYLTAQKLKVISGLFELDINASQAFYHFFRSILWLLTRHPVKFLTLVKSFEAISAVVSVSITNSLPLTHLGIAGSDHTSSQWRQPVIWDIKVLEKHEYLGLNSWIVL